MSGVIICHCGKCKITCNKHGKRGKCNECGKRRMLGTAITKGVITHICEECCDKYTPKPIEQLDEEKVYG